MNFVNPIDFVERDEIKLTIKGKPVTGYAIDLDEMTKLGKQFPWFGERLKGKDISHGDVPEDEVLDVSAIIVATCVAPDARGAERDAVIASARKIRFADRIDLMQQIITGSFPESGAVDAEGNVKVAGNRSQRRAARSKGGGVKQPT